jgi:hypothetical protein
MTDRPTGVVRSAAFPASRAQMLAALLLLPLVAIGGVLAADGLPPDARPFVAPIVASVLVFLAFAVGLRLRAGERLLGELGFVYMGFIVAYTVLPGLGFLASGVGDVGPVAGLLPESGELATHLWRQVLFQGGVAAGYLLARGTRTSATMAEPDRPERDGRTLLVVGILIAVAVSVVTFASAPVESYYDHYVRYDHLSWLPRKLVSVAIRLSLGLYCVLLVFLFRHYRRFRLVIPFVVVGIVAHELTYSYGARIQALIVLLQAFALYHFTVRPISLRTGALAFLALAALFSAIELVRAVRFDLDIARVLVEDEGFQPATEFIAVFFTGFHLYAERAFGALPPVEWPMFFHDFITLFTFGDFTRWNPMEWYARAYYPESVVAPFTLGPIADSAIWGGEPDLLVRGAVNGAFFAVLMRLFLRTKDRWWGLSAYVYVYATSILTLKYSVFLALALVQKNLLPTLLLVAAVRRFAWRRSPVATGPPEETTG